MEKSNRKELSYMRQIWAKIPRKNLLIIFIVSQLYVLFGAGMFYIMTFKESLGTGNEETNTQTGTVTFSQLVTKFEGMH